MNWLVEIAPTGSRPWHLRHMGRGHNSRLEERANPFRFVRRNGEIRFGIDFEGARRDNVLRVLRNELEPELEAAGMRSAEAGETDLLKELVGLHDPELKWEARADEVLAYWHDRRKFVSYFARGVQILEKDAARLPGLALLLILARLENHGARELLELFNRRLERHLLEEVAESAGLSWLVTPIR